MTRFERARAKIDLLAPEGIGSNVVTVPPGYAIQAPGSSQAISRARPVVVDWGAARVTVHCPSLLGAIVAKAAACREIVSITADERLKHQSDFVFLLSVATTLDIDALEGMAAEMTPRDRKRIKAALDPMAADGTHRSRFAAHNFDDVQDVATLLLG